MFHIFTFTKEEKLNIIDMGYQLTKQYLTLKGYKEKNKEKEKEKESINVFELLGKIKSTFDKIKNKK
jgi:hypothetical protein